MPRLSRLLTAAAACLLLAVFALPLWRISLIAPQYPEGLGMRIWIDAITGVKEYDLKNINDLNHYIGMRVIDAAAIPELRYMPWIVGALVAAGLVVASLGRRRPLFVWVASLAVAGLAGLADFWRWTYAYGHDLDWENAIIKVPGTVYQPPIIGTKQILNFHAASWPDLGGLAAGLAMVLALAASVVAVRDGRRSSVGGRRDGARGWAARTTAMALLVVMGACAGHGPAHMAYDGSESCALCRMPVTDRRFGAQLVTAKGRALRFDSIECLAQYVAAIPAGEAPGAVYVPDFAQPGRLVPVEGARFVRGTRVGSPMGQGVVAFDAAGDSVARVALGGEAVTWAQLAGADSDAARGSARP